MEPSILVSTKKILGLTKEYTAFDLDIITHINAAFIVLMQLGVGPITGFSIESHEETWEDYLVPSHHLSLAKTYVFLKVKLLFDPPGTSYLIEAINKQIEELEFRLNIFHETELPEEEVV